MLKLKMKNHNTILTEKQQKYQHYHQVRYEYLKSEERLPSDQSRKKEQAKFTHSLLCKAFERINKNN